MHEDSSKEDTKKMQRKRKFKNVYLALSYLEWNVLEVEFSSNYILTPRKSYDYRSIKIVNSSVLMWMFFPTNIKMATDLILFV